jgi:protein-disulfide isomerase-like protein with CxxC motif
LNGDFVLTALPCASAILAARVLDGNMRPPTRASHSRIVIRHRSTRWNAAAAAAYASGLDIAESLGMRPLVAHCHLGLAKLYRHTDKRKRVQQHLTTATTMYREMAMRFWLEKAEAEMKELA